MSHPTVSVLMPVYRTPSEYLRKAIDSVLNQTLTDLELVIVEDPSQETGETVVAAFDDSRIKYHLNSERTGLVAQRNLALKLAQGAWIAKADSDDISEPDRLQSQTDYLNQNPTVGVVGSWLTIVDSDGQPTGMRRYPIEPESIHRTFRRRNPIAQPTVCFRREIYDQFGGYPEGYPVCQDYAYWSHLAVRGVRFANLTAPLVRYRQHSQSIKATRMCETLRATIEIKKRYWSKELSIIDHGRILGEHALQLLPTGLVTWMFERLTYQSIKQHG